MTANRKATLARLRAEIGRIARPVREEAMGAFRPAALSGCEAVFQRGRLYEIAPATPADAAAPGFALACAAGAALDKPVIWCAQGHEMAETGRPYGPGLASLGLDPGDLILAEVRRAEDVLWAVEEAARSAAVGAVIGVVRRLDFTPSRRLAMAAATGRAPVFLIRPGGFEGASAAFARWRAGSVPALTDPLDAKGWDQVRWRLDLTHGQTMPPQSWLTVVGQQAVAPPSRRNVARRAG